MANSLIFINATDEKFPAPSALAHGASGPSRSTNFPVTIFGFATAGRSMTKSNLFSPIGNFNAATFWQRSPAITALGAFAYGQSAPRIK
jgi:hypothetical protein